jgi:hypothetical protein
LKPKIDFPVKSNDLAINFHGVTSAVKHEFVFTLLRAVEGLDQGRENLAPF